MKHHLGVTVLASKQTSLGLRGTNLLEEAEAAPLDNSKPALPQRLNSWMAGGFACLSVHLSRAPLQQWLWGHGSPFGDT